MRIPVSAGPKIVEMVEPGSPRYRALASAANSTLVRRRKSGQVVQIDLGDAGDDAAQNAKHGNPLSYSFRERTEETPAGVWQLKRIERETRGIFTTVVDECLAA